MEYRPGNPVISNRLLVIRNQFLILGLGLFLFMSDNMAQDGIKYQGQLSGWSNYNHSNVLPVWFGLRYIPQLNYGFEPAIGSLIDMEAAANLYGSLGSDPFDSVSTDGNIKPYRLWGRYSTDQLEIRLGLQKINFGSAAMLRPLMWFDQVDPRDPLQLTDGVWGVLGRYYFLNNINIWLWGLYGNNELKAWEIGKTEKNTPEFGGRFQSPAANGEIALSYHFRRVDPGDNLDPLNEQRIGIDGKWDIEIGIWFEAVWIKKNKNIGMFTNQELLNTGMDYTFGIGNGLNLIFEHLLFSYDEDAFSLSNKQSFSAVSLSYPLGIFDNLNAIIYYDWKNSSVYNFINLKRQYDNLSLFLMGYWNPEIYNVPQQSGTGNLFSGKGIQLMVVYNH
jgi:hypothetical protein